MGLSSSENRLRPAWHLARRWNTSAVANYAASICLPNLDKLSECLWCLEVHWRPSYHSKTLSKRGLSFKVFLAEFFFHLILASFVQSNSFGGVGKLLESKKWFCFMEYVSHLSRWEVLLPPSVQRGQEEILPQGGNRKPCRLVEKQLLKSSVSARIEGTGSQVKYTTCSSSKDLEDKYQ